MWIDVDDKPVKEELEGWKFNVDGEGRWFEINIGTGWNSDSLLLKDNLDSSGIQLELQHIPKLIKALTLAANHFKIPLDN